MTSLPNPLRSRRRSGTVHSRASQGPRRFVPAKPHRTRTFFLRLFAFLLLVLTVWSAWVVHQINLVASQDQAQPADAIAVFGAAEYGGRPSPVYHARLDHAVTLYQRGIAPLIITFGGGSDKDSGKTEGGVGRDYLLANGVPFDKIIAETHSTDTGEQVDDLASIAQERGLQHIVLVSDNTHLFRIQELCRRAGLDVYTSPRPALGHIDRFDLFQRYAHEVLSYTAMRLGLH
jgi:uncharacterized SAM-binding protein YcdF (DUF218 family)